MADFCGSVAPRSVTPKISGGVTGVTVSESSKCPDGGELPVHEPNFDPNAILDAEIGDLPTRRSRRGRRYRRQAK